MAAVVSCANTAILAATELGTRSRAPLRQKLNHISVTIKAMWFDGVASKLENNFS